MIFCLGETSWFITIGILIFQHIVLDNLFTCAAAHSIIPVNNSVGSKNIDFVSFLHGWNSGIPCYYPTLPHYIE